MPGGIWLTKHTFPNGLMIDLQWDFLHKLITSSRRSKTQTSLAQRLAVVIPEYQNVVNLPLDEFRMPESYLRYRILSNYLNLPLGAIILHCRNANFLIEAEDGTWHPTTPVWREATWFYQCITEIRGIHRDIMLRYRPRGN